MIRGKCLGFTKDLVTFRSGFVEGIHHEMQVVGQRAHAYNFFFICPCERNRKFRPWPGVRIYAPTDELCEERMNLITALGPRPIERMREMANDATKGGGVCQGRTR